MRAAIADVVLLSFHLLSWRCVDVIASGGALDSTSSYYTGPTHTPTSRLPSFTASLSDGIAQAVAHESGELKIMSFSFSLFSILHFYLFYHFRVSTICEFMSKKSS